MNTNNLYHRAFHKNYGWKYVCLLRRIVRWNFEQRDKGEVGGDSKNFGSRAWGTEGILPWEDIRTLWWDRAEIGKHFGSRDENWA